MLWFHGDWNNVSFIHVIALTKQSKERNSKVGHGNATVTQSDSLSSFSTWELGSTEAIQNNVWTKSVTTHRNYSLGFCSHRGML